MAALKIKCILPDVNHGLFWQRLRLPFQHVDAERFHVSFTQSTDIFSTRCNSDIYVIAHPSEKWEVDLALELKEKKKRLIVDIDDLLDNPPNTHPEADLLFHCQWSVPEVLQLADYVTTSTDYLARAYSHLNKHFSVIPNSLDTTIIPKGYVPVKKPYKTSFTIGWCGGHTHIGDQYEFAYGLDKFLENTEDSRAFFRPIAPQFLLNKYGVRCFTERSTCHFLDYHPWLATQPWDVGLVGLENHPFNDAKSDLRFIELARHGIPIITSPRDSFIPHIEAGRALQASSNDEFYEAIQWAYQNQDKLKAIGEKAREYVLNTRLDSHAAKLWESVFLATLQ